MLSRKKGRFFLEANAPKKMGPCLNMYGERMTLSGDFKKVISGLVPANIILEQKLELKVF